MDPAEEIVGLWLQQQDFFVMSGVKVGCRGKEIDFLAVKPSVGMKVHVEVHASVLPLGPLRPWGPAKYGKMSVEKRVKSYFEDKFVGATEEGTGILLNQCVMEMAENKLGSRDYEKWLVLGALHPTDTEDQLRYEFQKHGVKILFIKDILREIALKGASRQPTGRFLQLMASQLTDEAKANLLRLGKDTKKAHLKSSTEHHVQ
jgi:hypothetical protein